DHDLLSQLREKGVEVKTTGDDRLVIDAPRGTITEELRTALSAHKAELLQMLNAEKNTTAPAPLSEPPALVPTAPENVSAPLLATAPPEAAEPLPVREAARTTTATHDEDATIAASAAGERAQLQT